VTDREGNELGEYQYQGNVANRSLELLGKHLGLFIDKVEHTGKEGGAIEVRDLTVRDRAIALVAFIEKAKRDSEERLMDK
jgi:hypothetical protein